MVIENFAMASIIVLAALALSVNASMKSMQKVLRMNRQPPGTPQHVPTDPFQTPPQVPTNVIGTPPHGPTDPFVTPPPSGFVDPVHLNAPIPPPYVLHHLPGQNNGASPGYHPGNLMDDLNSENGGNVGPPATPLTTQTTHAADTPGFINGVPYPNVLSPLTESDTGTTLGMDGLESDDDGNGV